MTVVKICGVMDTETALVALEAGADMLGFVLAPSRRQLSPDTVAEIAGEARRRFPPGERPWLAVGVFANQPLELVAAAVALAGLDVVQLSGQEEPEYCGQLKTPLFKALHLGTGAEGRPTTKTPDTQSPTKDLRDASCSSCLRVSVPHVAGFRQRYGAERVLLDSGGAGAWGGTGRRFGWEQIGRAARDCLVAGGLSPANVGEAIALLRPWGVDVSSGVETGGRKDPALIRSFISEVRRSDSHGSEE